MLRSRSSLLIASTAFACLLVMTSACDDQRKAKDAGVVPLDGGFAPVDAGDAGMMPLDGGFVQDEYDAGLVDSGTTVKGKRR